MLNVLDAVQQHPEAMRAAFVYTARPLDATCVEELFTISWSENGSNKFRAEKSAVTHWRDFLQDAEGNNYLLLLCRDFLSINVIFYSY